MYPDEIKVEVSRAELSENDANPVFAELQLGIYSALETYANVHRGSGFNSVVTTDLFEQARVKILEHLGLSQQDYLVIFSAPAVGEYLTNQLEPGSWQCLSSADLDLPLGVRVIVVKKDKVHQRIQFKTGGGTARLISPDWVVWAKLPERFEPGTPAIINILSFVKALQLKGKYGNDAFNSYNNYTAHSVLHLHEFEQLSGRELLNVFRETCIGNHHEVPTVEGMQPFINLDNSASTPAFTPIWDAFVKTLHMSKDEQQKMICEAKAIGNEFFHAPETDYDILFTSNTTEAINIAAENLKLACGNADEAIVINTISEHNSNELAWRTVPGCKLIGLKINGDGIPDLDELEQLLRKYNRGDAQGKKRVKLVAVTGSSNVLGVCNDLRRISGIVHHYGAHLLVDAAQLVAHREINIQDIGIDFLGFSAHKMYAPFGSGMLIIKKGLLKFSAEEIVRLQRSGEENAAGIAALGKAMILLKRIGFDVIRDEELVLTKRLITGLKKIPGIKIFGMQDETSSEFGRKGGVVVFEVQGMMADKVAKYLAEKSGIGVRAGCHCAHILIKHLLKIPPVLQRIQKWIVMLFPKIELPGVVRVSLGLENTTQDVDTLLESLEGIAS
ncbi:MAG: aminotransferase class V-fold PLP-dependent enzyme, partial [Ignavibacteriales bacterium]|nr:aminotransferase class V-fold PLP-dependent enzyme [Ignavibacteriales bacterium]